MSDLYGPVHRALRFMLLAAFDDISSIGDVLDNLDRFATVENEVIAPLVVQADPLLQAGLDGERAAIAELRSEVRAQLDRVRAAEAGAARRLQGLLHLLLEAELRHMLRKEREIEPRLRRAHGHALIDERADALLQLIGPRTFS